MILLESKGTFIRKNNISEQGAIYANNMSKNDVKITLYNTPLSV